MKITADHLGTLLDAITKDSSGDELSSKISGFVALVAKHGMLHRLPSIEESFSVASRKRRGVRHAVIESARELSEKERSSIEKQLGDGCETEYRITPSVQHGVRITVDGKRVDSTLAGRLQRLRSHLS